MPIRTSSHSRFRFEIPFREGTESILDPYWQYYLSSDKVLFSPSQLTQILYRARIITVTFQTSVSYYYADCSGSIINETSVVETQKKLTRKTLERLKGGIPFSEIELGYNYPPFSFDSDLKDADEHDVIKYNLRESVPISSGFSLSGYALWLSYDKDTGRNDFIRICGSPFPFERDSGKNLILRGGGVGTSPGMGGYISGLTAIGKLPLCPPVFGAPAYGGNDILATSGLLVNSGLNNSGEAAENSLIANMKISGSEIPVRVIVGSSADADQSGPSVEVHTTSSSLISASIEVSEWFEYATTKGLPAWDKLTGRPINGGPAA